jgi:lipid-binding SYLF domain-containing protein
MMKKMMIMKIAVLACMLAGLVFSTARAGWDPADEDHAKAGVEFFKKNAPVLDRFFEKAYGYVVFPDVFKGGYFIVGGGHGNGYVYELNTLVGHSSITQFNVGPQLGGQSFSEIIFFKDKAELDNFKKGNYELNAQVEGVVATTGAATTIDYSHGVAVFVLPKAGIMAEATVGGQKFSYRQY